MRTKWLRIASISLQVVAVVVVLAVLALWASPWCAVGRVVDSRLVAEGQEELVQVEVPGWASSSRLVVVPSGDADISGTWIVAAGGSRVVADQRVVVARWIDSLSLPETVADVVPAPMLWTLERFAESAWLQLLAGVLVLIFCGGLRRVLGAVSLAGVLAIASWQVVVAGAWSGWWPADPTTALAAAVLAAALGARGGGIGAGWVPAVSARLGVGGTGALLAADLPTAALGFSDVAGWSVLAALGAVFPNSGVGLVGGSLIALGLEADATTAWVVVLVAMVLTEVGVEGGLGRRLRATGPRDTSSNASR